MESTYREIAPSSNLVRFVECFWTGDVDENHAARILPDGCADIIFVLRNSELLEAEVVGVMTQAKTVDLAAGTSLLGIRFQPGMAGMYLRSEMLELNNRSVPLRSVCDYGADDLVRAACRGRSAEEKVAALEEKMSHLPKINRVQQAIAELAGQKGQLSLDEVAVVAGIGQRQLRRACLKHSGLTPKHLARILRFRNAADRLRHGETNHAALAADCGYCDQAHMIRDFSELAGMSPTRYLRQRP
jgi:AraC-like DNA-binding protein